MDNQDMDYASLLRVKRQKEEEFKSKYKVSSKERLVKIVSSKVRTTMIGALETVETHFGFLWNNNSEDAREMRDIYEKVRSEILDRGNNQIRNLMTELEQYDIEWKRYNIQLPVKPLGRSEG